jgi:ATP-binding cassette subfamily F protein 3
VSRANSRGQPAPPVPGAAIAAPAVAAPSTPRSAKPAAAPAAAPANNSRDDRKTKGQARSKLADQTRPLRNELATIDQRLAKLGAERTQTEALLARSTVAPTAIADAGRQLAHIAAEVAMLEERWLELHQQLEGLAVSR